MRITFFGMLLVCVSNTYGNPYLGTWGVCDPEVHTHDRISITSTEFRRHLVEYEDAQCAKPWLEIDFRATYGMTQPAHVPHRHIDLQFYTMRLTIYGGHWLKWAQEKPMCGYSDWEPGTTHEILGTDCETLFGIYPSHFDNIYVGLDQVLFLGDTLGAENGSTPESRPSELDRRNPFRKVLP